MSGPVSYQSADRIALITIDNPPVNALSQAVRAGLVDAMERFDADDESDVALLSGQGRLFISGADIAEFGKPPLEPFLPDVVNRIEACKKPIIALVHGSTFGGGLEIAMGAHFRLADASAKLAMPEVKLGLMPGASGTFRLPRLVGVDKALSMICGGQPVGAVAAHDMGLIDELVESQNLSAAGIQFAQKVLAEPLAIERVGERPAPTVDESVFESWKKKLTSSARGQPAPAAAVDSVRYGCQHRLKDALKEERRLFMELMATPERAAMIHAFFSERKVSKLPELKGVAVRPVSQIGVVGGGTMGAGIATAALLSQLSVCLVEQNLEAANRAVETVRKNLAAAVKRGKLSESQHQFIMERRFQAVVGYDALAQSDLIIEAVFEDMDVKKSVFESLDAVAKPGAILATNTSYLDINEIARATKRPESVIGLHFFSPAHIMKLLEVVVADKTAPELVATSFALARNMGKVAVRAGVCDGFIGNRILSHYRSAADHMILDGASPYQIDKALRGYGFPMGPYEVADLAGLDIGYAARKRKAASRDPRERYPSWADDLVHQGRLGQKTGKGYYVYNEGSRQGVPDDHVEHLISASRQQAGTNPRVFSDEEIVSRYLVAMINECARVLDEGIASRPLDIDIVLLFGYGFPRSKGGPLHAADQLGLQTVVDLTRQYAQEDEYFWNVAPLLGRLLEQGKDFNSLNSSG